MKQYHYEELQNAKDLNYFQRISETGHMNFIISLVIAIIVGAILIFICFKIEKNNSQNEAVQNESRKYVNSEWHLITAFLAVIVIGASFIILIIELLFSVNQYKATGYYRAEAKVLSIEKKEKVDEATQYKMKCRYMKGNIEDKKTKPITITTNNRQDIKNGDKVLIKTPDMIFKGGESKKVKDQDLIEDINNRRRQFEIFRNNKKEVPNRVEEKDLTLTKDTER
ncbi:hypothetical protein [Staphylococcus pasteuri]|uniref:hypothetical protein n=1 Tax=Staphylococcus pasteuri TaxID=45972 RepID=UPI0010B82B46|nr:hypothetical protein [Staphylococcus pasteuri]EAC3257004.1 hypothetical protein [Listeria monocytogenes]